MCYPVCGMVHIKEHLLLTRHSLCYTSRGVLAGTRKEGNVLFNDALNTFYLLLYGVRHIVKDHSDSERENPLPKARRKKRMNILVNE